MATETKTSLTETKTGPSETETKTSLTETKTGPSETETKTSLTETKKTGPSETETSLPGEEVKSEVNGASSSTVVTEELKTKIVEQVNYYFGNYNLPRDKFLSEQVKLDNGWVSLETMVKFKRLADLTTDHAVIRDALKKSELMEVNDEKNCVRRSPDHPLPYVGEDIKAETIKRTIYCKGIPKDGSVTLDMLLAYFKDYGPYETIHMRHFHDKATNKQGFKGSILIVFPDENKAKEFMDIDDVKFRGTPLLRKWHQHYLEEKQAEIKERKARKEARLEQLKKEGAATGAPELNEIDPIPRGSFLFASGFTTTTTREDIKAALLPFTDDVAFVDFSKGLTEGYIRLSTPNSNKETLEKIGDKLKVNDADITLRIVENEEEDEQIKRAEMARAKVMSQSNRKRKGGGRGRGFNKRRRF